MTPILNAVLIAVAVAMSAAVYKVGPEIDARWDHLIQELKR